ncbi:hypothetical protein [Haloarchaeobius iranensis]|uniref:Uncharacterized protein n=1 Tax=Haloarchaeobius iranensis TaxID=996166 RepID=A0A1G9ZB99_9EURY|nr:hypothetical protein [Haloarchaeobius iranensis]SDN18327.1 hypothetical protein SAMN05192554_11920 [Haloarchaeobius iranensis]
MNRRRFLASTTSTLAVAILAGCLGPLGGDDDDESTPTPTDSTSAPTTTHASTDDDIVDTTHGQTDTQTDGPLSDEQTFDPDHPIRVENNDSTTHTLTLRIRRDGQQDHSLTRDLEPGFEDVVYNLEQLEPERIVQYQVVAEVGSEQDSRAVQTNACFGDVNVAISDGEPRVGFEIC